MIIKNVHIILFLFLVGIWCNNAAAQVRLPKYISDGVVFQRNEKIKIWGYASPFEKVELIFKQKKYSTTTGTDSIWRITLPKQKAGGPYQLEFKASNNITISNVLFGDVWLCSGQSNMEINFERLKDKYPDIVKSAINSNIRQFYAPRTYNFNTPQQDFPTGSWKEVHPNNIKEFSGVAYFFAQYTYEKEKIPIGLINNAVGGAPVQAWLNEASLKKFPEYLKEAITYKDQKHIDSINAYNAKTNKIWFQQLNSKDEGLKHNWYQQNIKRIDWQEVMMPTLWSAFDKEIEPGAIWLHKSFEVDKKYLNRKCRLFLGCIVDADSVYINGVYVGSTAYQYPPRKYEIPSSLLKEGKNEITIRVIDQNGKGGMVEGKVYGILFPEGDTINLKGKWLLKVGCTMPKMESQVFIQWKSHALYNTMLTPLFHYPVKGILWYQGEANVHKPDDYFDLMKELIALWRNGWKKNKLPVYYVQLTNFGKVTTMPAESKLAALRQQQLDMLKIKNTGMAVTIDVGEWNDLHPHNKKDVGYRLALHALKNEYRHNNIVASGPLYKNHELEGSTVVLEFLNVDKGIKNKSDLKHFELAGEDRIFYEAKATIKDNKVWVYIEKILNPVYLRFAWKDSPDEFNFYNEEGLPASPFELKL